MAKTNRWLLLSVSVLALLMAGIIYAWSFLKSPLAELYGWDSRGFQLQLNYTLTLCFFCIGGLISGLSGKKISPRVRMIIGGACVAAGFWIVSTLDGTSALMLYMGYGCMAGLGIGIVYNVVISSTNAWFPDRKGVASGSMMLGFGFSAMVLGNLAVRLFQTSVGWRGTFRIYGIVIGLCLALAGFIIRPPMEGEVPAQAAGVADGGKEYSPKEMLGRSSFWKLFVFCTILGAIGSVAIGQARDFILHLDAGGAVMASLGASMISVMNGSGRLLEGALFDRIGMRKTQFFNSVMLMLAPLVMLGALLAKSTIVGFIGLCLCGLAFSFSPTVTATFVMVFYGKKNFSLNFPLLTLTLIPASFAATLAGLLSFNATYAILSVIAVIGAVLNIFIKEA